MIKDDDISVFSRSVAMLLDTNCAIIYSMLKGWVKHNETNKQNFFDGRYWTFNSMKAWSLQLPFLTEKQIRSSLDKLENAGLIVTGNYNKVTYDRTKWYSVNPVPEEAKPLDQEGMFHLPYRANGTALQGKPIPILNTTTNTIIKTNDNNLLNEIKDTLSASESGTLSENPVKSSAHQEMVVALEAVTGMDLKIKTNAGRIVKLSKELREAGYAPDDVQTFASEWRHDWRSKDGSLPTIAIIKAEIGKVKAKVEATKKRDNQFRELYREQQVMKGL